MLEMSGSQASDSSSPMVIGTKLRVPSPRREQMIRPRLLEMLDKGLDGKVTLISAHCRLWQDDCALSVAGDGREERVFRLGLLDEQDNDPIRMWRHIVESLTLAMPGKSSGAPLLPR